MQRGGGAVVVVHCTREGRSAPPFAGAPIDAEEPPHTTASGRSSHRVRGRAPRAVEDQSGHCENAESPHVTTSCISQGETTSARDVQLTPIRRQRRAVAVGLLL